MPGRIQMIVEHRMYLPVAALIALAAVGVAARFGRAGMVALLAWAGALGCLAESRNAVYRDAYSYGATRSPNARTMIGRTTTSPTRWSTAG